MNQVHSHRRSPQVARSAPGSRFVEIVVAALLTSGFAAACGTGTIVPPAEGIERDEDEVVNNDVVNNEVVNNDLVNNDGNNLDNNGERDVGVGMDAGEDVAVDVGEDTMGPMDASEEDVSVPDVDVVDAAEDVATDVAEDVAIDVAEDVAQPDAMADVAEDVPVTPTGGCGQEATIARARWVERSVEVDGVMRTWFVWLPETYDPNRTYPVVYQFHGCSDNRETNNPPVQRESGEDAIHVRGRAIGRCWNEGADVAFFDAMVVEVESNWCADPGRRFATGYSSGSFMTHRLSCDRGDVLRGVASIAGGRGGNSCVGRVAALMIHDVDDPTVNISTSYAARDLNLTRNACGDATAAREPFDPSPCEVWTGCDAGYPVVFCQTSGMNHSRQDGLSAPAFWSFLSGLSSEE